ARSFALTFVCLALTGATDTVSMVIRNVIRQLQTPDEMRGRMTSNNMIFFMGGPQLGELEAGLVAQAWGAPFSVVTGGLGCLLAVPPAEAPDHARPAVARAAYARLFCRVSPGAPGHPAGSHGIPWRNSCLEPGSRSHRSRRCSPSRPERGPRAPRPRSTNSIS